MLTRMTSQDHGFLRRLTLLSIFISASILGLGREASALTPEAVAAATAAKVRAQCEIKRIAKACYETGLTEMHYNDAKHRKSARHFLKVACSIEKRAICNRNETKVATKAYLATPGRMPAAAFPKAPIAAPKIAASKTGGFPIGSAPAPYEPNRAPLEPLHPQQPIQPMPQQEMAPPPPPQNNEALPPGTMQPNFCAPGDTTCAPQ